MKTKFEECVGNIINQLNEHQADEAEDQKLKETMSSILKSKGVEASGLVDELFNAFQTHLSNSKRKTISNLASK